MKINKLHAANTFASFLVGILVGSSIYYSDASITQEEIKKRSNSIAYDQLEAAKIEIQKSQDRLHKKNEIISTLGNTPVGQSFIKMDSVTPWDSLTNSKGEQFKQIYSGLGDERLINLHKYKSPMNEEHLVMIETESKKIGIDPVIPYCIAFADSGFGTEGAGAKTKNPCNLGNTDSGGLKHFPTYMDGMRACVKQLDRPQYKNTDLLGELSNGGRILLGLNPDSGDWGKGDKVWASSSENHVINMTRCVRAIKHDYEIDVAYNFKTNK